MRRGALIVIILAAIALLAMPQLHIAVAVITIVAAALAMLPPKPGVVTVPPSGTALDGLKPVATPGSTKRLTALVASINPANMTDLQRILAGIVADERGKVVSSNGGPIVATFGTAAAAVHAAQRMVSNVDALARRLDRLIVLSVGIDNSVDDATRLEQLTHEKRIAVLVGSAAANAADSSSLAEVEAGLFSFTPVQQRLF